MDLSRIDFPDHLEKHTLSAQVLTDLQTDGQRALAIEWNIQSRKIEWLVSNYIQLHNIVVEHDRALETWRKVYWLIGIIGASGGGLAGVLKLLEVLK